MLHRNLPGGRGSVPALVMRTANAAIHGHGVTKLEQAVLRLGAVRLEVVILEYATRKVFEAKGPFEFFTAQASATNRSSVNASRLR